MLGGSMKMVDRLRLNPPSIVADWVHGNAEKLPSHALNPVLESSVVEILGRGLYCGLGPTLAQEALEECPDLVLAKESVRKIMGKAGLKMSLTILVDDATSVVVGACFEMFESALGYA